MTETTSHDPLPRRDRQLAEIVALVAAGDQSRAAGLALEHAARYREDALLLAELTASDLADQQVPGSEARSLVERDGPGTGVQHEL